MLPTDALVDLLLEKYQIFKNRKTLVSNIIDLSICHGFSKSDIFDALGFNQNYWTLNSEMNSVFVENCLKRSSDLKLDPSMIIALAKKCDPTTFYLNYDHDSGSKDLIAVQKIILEEKLAFFKLISTKFNDYVVDLNQYKQNVETSNSENTISTSVKKSKVVKNGKEPKTGKDPKSLKSSKQQKNEKESKTSKEPKSLKESKNSKESKTVDPGKRSSEVDEFMSQLGFLPLLDSKASKKKDKNLQTGIFTETNDGEMSYSPPAVDMDNESKEDLMQVDEIKPVNSGSKFSKTEANNQDIIDKTKTSKKRSAKSPVSVEIEKAIPEKDIKSASEQREETNSSAKSTSKITIAITEKTMTRLKEQDSGISKSEKINNTKPIIRVETSSHYNRVSSMSQDIRDKLERSVESEENFVKETEEIKARLYNDKKSKEKDSRYEVNRAEDKEYARPTSIIGQALAEKRKGETRAFLQPDSRDSDLRSIIGDHNFETASPSRSDYNPISNRLGPADIMDRLGGKSKTNSPSQKYFESESTKYSQKKRLSEEDRVFDKKQKVDQAIDAKPTDKNENLESDEKDKHKVDSSISRKLDEPKNKSEEAFLLKQKLKGLKSKADQYEKECAKKNASTEKDSSKGEEITARKTDKNENLEKERKIQKEKEEALRKLEEAAKLKSLLESKRKEEEKASLDEKKKSLQTKKHVDSKSASKLDNDKLDREASKLAELARLKSIFGSSESVERRDDQRDPSPKAFDWKAAMEKEEEEALRKIEEANKLKQALQSAKEKAMKIANSGAEAMVQDKPVREPSQDLEDHQGRKQKPESQESLGDVEQEKLAIKSISDRKKDGERIRIEQEKREQERMRKNRSETEEGEIKDETFGYDENTIAKAQVLVALSQRQALSVPPLQKGSNEGDIQKFNGYPNQQFQGPHTVPHPGNQMYPPMPMYPTYFPGQWPQYQGYPQYPPYQGYYQGWRPFPQYPPEKE